MHEHCLAIITILIICLIVATGLLKCNRDENMTGFNTMINLDRKIVFHYTNWCHYCKLMKPIWAQVMKSTEGSGITYVEINEEVTKTPGINTYPTILMYSRGGRVSKYPGNADFEKLRAWAVSPTRYDK